MLRAGSTRDTSTRQRSRSVSCRVQAFGQLIDDTLDDAYGQRQITQYFTQLNTYPVILEVPL